MYLARMNYDKHHRCPGWSGGGWTYPKRERCDGGSLMVPGSWNLERTMALPADPWWKWKTYKCRKCDVLVLPYITRWLDPTWLAWTIKRRFL